VRVGGLEYTCTPGAGMGQRISDMRLKGEPLQADKPYKVAGWAPVSEEAKDSGEPVWDVVARYLKAQKTIRQLKINTPKLVGVDQNPGMVL
jgi:S-sulfosulfanyl-L-cysteine sulfohydrolase